MVSYQQDNGVHTHRVKREDVTKKLILLVEDDAITASLLCQVIEQETAYQIAHTVDGSTAWKFLQYVKPQLVILDYRLPGMNGIQLYDLMYGNNDLHDVPVLLLSAVPPAAEVARRKMVSLQKPFDLNNFLCTIAAILSTEST